MSCVVCARVGPWGRVPTQSTIGICSALPRERALVPALHLVVTGVPPGSLILASRALRGGAACPAGTQLKLASVQQSMLPSAKVAKHPIVSKIGQDRPSLTRRSAPSPPPSRKQRREKIIFCDKRPTGGRAAGRHGDRRRKSRARERAPVGAAIGRYAISVRAKRILGPGSDC